MRTEVAILHHDYPARVRGKVEQKIEGLNKFFERTVSIRAMLERQNDDHRVELVANVGRGSVLVADARRSAFGAALDEAADRMGRLLKRHNQKLTDRRHGRG